MKKNKEIYLILILSILSVLSYSQNDSLNRYIQIAEKNNPELMGKFDEYKAQLEKVSIVGSLPDPNITLGYFLKSMELMEGNQVADIKLMQMFPWFGTLKASKNEASQMAKSKYEEARDVKNNISFNVRSLYYQLYQTEQKIKLSEKNLEILKTIKELALVKFKTGDGGKSSAISNQQSAISGQQSAVSNMQQGENKQMVSQTGASGNMQQEGEMGGTAGNGGLAELFSLQLEMNETENNILLLKNNKEALKARFNSYLNRSPKFDVTIADTLKTDTSIIEGIMTDSILKNNPMLGMINADKEANEASINMSKLMKYPMLGIGVDYSIISKRNDVMSGMNGKDMVMPMISATLPIYRKKYNAQIREATFRRSATENKYNAAVNTLNADYTGIIKEQENAKQSLRFTRNQASLTQMSLNLLINKFSVSKADMSEILRVQQQLLEYKVKSIEALVEIMTTEASLKLIIGK